MENKDASAFGFSANLGGEMVYSPGLTKREYFAAMAMQGILANTGMIDNAGDSNVRWVAQTSLRFADELLKELEQ